jgi:hypothetical protein
MAPRLRAYQELSRRVEAYESREQRIRTCLLIKARRGEAFAIAELYRRYRLRLPLQESLGAPTAMSAPAPMPASVVG